MTTHILEVAERLADRIGIIARGKMIAEGTLDELRARIDADGATLETVFLDLTSRGRTSRVIRRLIRSLAAFPRFVLHDLRLSARALASMFGSLSLRRLAALIALLFVALHVAAYPVAGWLIGVEDGPDGLMRLTAIPRQRRRARFSLDRRPVDRGLHPHSVWTLGSRVDPRFARRCARSACRPRLVDFGRGRRIGRALAGAARRRRRSQGPSALAGALSGPDRGGARGDGLCDHSVDGPVFCGRPATRAPLRPDRGDSDRRVRRARGAGCRHAARGRANGDSRGLRAACKCRRRAARPPVGAGARGGGRPARDARLDSVRRRRLCAGLRTVRRALRARGDRHCGRAGSSRRRSEGDGALWRSASTALRIRSGASSGATLAHVATPSEPPTRRRSP